MVAHTCYGLFLEHTGHLKERDKSHDQSHDLTCFYCQQLRNESQITMTISFLEESMYNILL